MMVAATWAAQPRLHMYDCVSRGEIIDRVQEVNSTADGQHELP